MPHVSKNVSRWLRLPGTLDTKPTRAVAWRERHDRHVKTEMATCIYVTRTPLRPSRRGAKTRARKVGHMADGGNGGLLTRQPQALRVLWSGA